MQKKILRSPQHTSFKVQKKTCIHRHFHKVQMHIFFIIISKNEFYKDESKSKYAAGRESSIMHFNMNKNEP